MHLLKASTLSTLKPGVNSKTGAAATKLYADGGNLFLQVTATGAKSWLYIYRDATHKQRWMGLGSLTGAGTGIAISLADARDLAAKAREQVKLVRLFPQSDALLPIEAKRANRISPATFAEMLALYIKLHGAGWKVKNGVCAHAKDMEDKLYLHAAKLIGVRANEKKAIKAAPGMLVANVTVQDVVAVLEPIWAKDVGERVRDIIEQVMKTAIENDHYKGKNPALLTGIAGRLGRAFEASGENQPSLDPAKLPAVMAQLMDEDRMNAKASVFATLTAARSDEARLMKWSEVNFATKMWTVPADRMKVKAKNDQGGIHLVPLSDAALALLGSISKRGDNDHVFYGKVKGQPVGKGSLNDMIAKDRSRGGLLALQGEATQHGMRATFSTWANSQKGRFAHDVIELCLAHVVGTKVSRAYNHADRIEERAELLQAWGNFAIGRQNVVTLQVAA